MAMAMTKRTWLAMRHYASVSGEAQVGSKGGEHVMRYVVTALLALELGIMAMAPVASAQVNAPSNSSFTNQ
jgi:hypothetical protein